MDIIGREFDWLTVLEDIGPKGSNRTHYFRCRCRCGKIKEVRKDKLLSGNTTSCRCKNTFKLGQESLRKSHGMSGTKEYNTWQSIKNRCYNENCEDYPDYGGRGIVMDEIWKESFEVFFEHVGICTDDKYSIDRIDTNKGYVPGNVRWADKFTQARNRRNNRLLTYKGETMTMIEWAELMDVPYRKIAKRLKRGWSIERTLETK
jgi:hypothetical protein